MLRLQNFEINNELATEHKVVLQYLVEDINRYDSNSNVLSVLFSLVEVILT